MIQLSPFLPCLCLPVQPAEATWPGRVVDLTWVLWGKGRLQSCTSTSALQITGWFQLIYVRKFPKTQEDADACFKSCQGSRSSDRPLILAVLAPNVHKAHAKTKDVQQLKKKYLAQFLHIGLYGPVKLHYFFLTCLFCATYFDLNLQREHQKKERWLKLQDQLRSLRMQLNLEKNPCQNLGSQIYRFTHLQTV